MVMKKRGARIKPTDPLLRAEPWRVSLVFDPIEAVLSRLEIDGTITTAPNGSAVFIEPGHNEWYDTAEALRGIVEFHEIASNRRGEVASVDGLRRLADLRRWAVTSPKMIFPKPEPTSPRASAKRLPCAAARPKA